jgi:hypothetical protein
MYSERGIAAVKCGVLPESEVTGLARLSLRPRDLTNLAKLYALAAFHLCNVAR